FIDVGRAGPHKEISWQRGRALRGRRGGGVTGGNLAGLAARREAVINHPLAYPCVNDRNNVFRLSLKIEWNWDSLIIVTIIENADLIGKNPFSEPSVQPRAFFLIRERAHPVH